MSEEIKDFLKQIEIIGKIPYLKNYHYEDKRTLANIGSFKVFKPTEIIISTENVISEMFFLIRGEVGIYIDSSLIKSCRGGGQIFGEMSFVNHTTPSADVKAETEVVMLTIPFEKIMQLPETSMRLQKELYKSVAEILAQKLMATNQMAKTYGDKLKDLEID
jgi:signal-transduction protein with cAMP-binding, CBS, and nucleotidyltransferase domain